MDRLQSCFSSLTTGPGVGHCNCDSEISYMLEIKQEQQTVIMVYYINVVIETTTRSSCSLQSLIIYTHALLYDTCTVKIIVTNATILYTVYRKSLIQTHWDQGMFRCVSVSETRVGYRVRHICGLK